MRRFDKLANIKKANVLLEKRIIEEKSLLKEDWKTNVAAGLASIGGVAGANAQTNKTVAPEQGKEITHNQASKSNSDVANPFGVEDTSMIHPRTMPIVGIQSGVTDGKTGKSAVYVYHNNKPGDANFNVKRDRETVYTSNLSDLYKTVEYQNYARSLSNANESSKDTIAVDEDDAQGGSEFKPMVGMESTNLKEPGFKGVIEHVGSDYFVLRSGRNDRNPILIKPFQYYNFKDWTLPQQGGNQ
jgi:hypothetical protein